jgi:hypothetical protein
MADSNFAYDNKAWLAEAEQVFMMFSLQQSGYMGLYACRRFLQSAPDEFYRRNPEVWTALVVEALKDGIGLQALAEDARIGVSQARERLSAAGYTGAQLKGLV